MFIHGTDGGYQAGIEEGFDAGAELLGGLFRGARNVIYHRAAAGFAGGAIFRVESRERGPDAFGCFGDGKIDLHFRLTAELFESACSGAVQERAGFGDAGVELRGSFAGDHARGFHHANKLAIGNAVGGSFKLFGGLAERFVQAAACLRLDFASGFFDEFLGLGEIALRIGGEFFEALRNFFCLSAIGGLLLFPAALDLAKARLEVAENFLAGRAHQRFQSLLGKFTKLLEISFADAFHSREGGIDGFIEMCGQCVLNDFFGGSLQFALHCSNELVDGDGDAFRL